MTELKRLSYKLEDTFVLGRSLPVVAIRQIKRLSDQIRALEDHPDYLPRTPSIIAEIIDDFVESNKHLLDDERELKEVFERVCKMHKFGPSMLLFFKNNK